jgi:HAD superfamily hydrolase (TIGR01509 family)
MNKIQAVIFDMDGVLTDSEPRHFHAINLLLAEFGCELAAEEYAHLAGQHGHYTWQWLRSRFGLPLDFEQWRDRYDPVIVAELSRPSEPLPGVIGLLTEVRNRNLRAAVASTSRSSWVTAALGSLGLAQAFDAVIAGDMVEHGKPAPDVFLLAATWMSVQPASCIVIEDSEPGIQAARAAGMFVVQLRATGQAAAPSPLSDIVIDDLRDFPLDLLSAHEEHRV